MATETGDKRRAEPLRQLGGTVGRLPRYLNLAQALMRDPAVSGRRKAALGAGLAYTVSPVDLVPGIIPVVGQLDDLTALMLGIRTALRGCTPAAADAHLARVGLSFNAIDQDLAIVRRAALWLAAEGARFTARLIARTVTGVFRLLQRHGPLGRTGNHSPGTAAHDRPPSPGG